MNRCLLSITLCLLLSLTCFNFNLFKAAAVAPYTVLVYMNGSDLESGEDGGAATADLQEMMQLGSTTNMNVVVETGGTAQ